MHLAILAASACALALGGCATITRGTTDQVQLQSEPSEARATTSIGQSCLTPCTLTMSRKDEFTVSFSKDGYEPQQVDVKTQVAGSGAAGFAGNILFGGVIGMGADVATGAALEHVPNPVRVDLVRIKPIIVAPSRPEKSRPRVKRPSVS
jgi:hypothetical protein